MTPVITLGGLQKKTEGMTKPLQVSSETRPIVHIKKQQRAPAGWLLRDVYPFWHGAFQFAAFEQLFHGGNGETFWHLIFCLQDAPRPRWDLLFSLPEKNSLGPREVDEWSRDDLSFLKFIWIWSFSCNEKNVSLNPLRNFKLFLLPFLQIWHWIPDNPVSFKKWIANANQHQKRPPFYFEAQNGTAFQFVGRDLQKLRNDTTWTPPEFILSCNERKPPFSKIRLVA